MKDMDDIKVGLLIAFVCVVALILLYLGSVKVFEGGYKQGQIDYAKGIIKYVQKLDTTYIEKTTF